MKQRRGWLVPVLAAGFVAAILFAIARGPVPLSLAQVLHGVTHPYGNRPSEIIVSAIREPRALCAAFVGAALGVSGAIVQAIFRNPMADPGIIGVSAGGSLGAVVALAGTWTVVTPVALPACAFVGAAIAVTIVYMLSTRGGRSSLIGLILAGIIISSMIDSGVSLVLTFSNNDMLRSIVFWLMGGFDGDGWTQFQLVAPPIVVGLAIAFFFTRELDLLATGEDSAHSSGVSVEWVKRLLIALVALLTGASVAISGTIAFVGLLVPHAARRMVGPRHRLVLPVSALLGGILLVLADLFARTINPTFEINVGIVTSFLGGPFFLYLLLRSERRIKS